MVWLLLKTGKNKIMANRISNVPSWFFWNLKRGKKKEIASMFASKMGGGIKFTSRCLRGYRIFWHGVSEVKIPSQGALGVMGANLNILNSNLVSVQHTRLLLMCGNRIRRVNVPVKLTFPKIKLPACKSNPHPPVTLGKWGTSILLWGNGENEEGIWIKNF